MMDHRVDLILLDFQLILDIMTNALKENDQKLALAATEFWSGIFQAVRGDVKNEEFVIKTICYKLPELCPLLLDCCKFTEYDRQMLPTTSGTNGTVPEEQQEDEDYESSFTTLRKSSAFTMERLSSKLIFYEYYEIQRYITMRYFVLFLGAQKMQ